MSAGDEPAKTSHGSLSFGGLGASRVSCLEKDSNTNEYVSAGSNRATAAGSNLTSSLNEEGLLQSPLVSPTAHLPLHQPNVDVAATFGVSLSMVGNLEVLITDIDAGKYKELLSGMTNDKRKVVFDALGAMCDLIKAKSGSQRGSKSDGTMNKSSVPVTMHMSSPVKEVLIHSIDDVAALFGVPLNSLKDIDEFTKDLEVGKRDLWLELTKETRSGITDIICNWWDTLLNMQNSAPTIDDNVSGASAKDQPKVNSNFHHLVVDPIFDGVNISIPCKVVKKVNSKADLVDVVTIGIPSLTGEGFTKETIRAKYEWRPPRCDICKIFGHVHDHCPKKVVSPPIVTTTTFVTPIVEKSNNGFQMVGKKKKRKGQFKSTNEDKDEAVENMYDESDNLLTNKKTSGNSSFTAAAESKDAIFDENHFSSIPRPKDIIANSVKSQRDDHSDDVPSETPEPRRDPITYNEVMQSRDATFWKEAIDDEIGFIMENNTWVLSDLPPGCKPLGFRQKEGIDYIDTYAPVARITTIRLLLALVATHNLVIHQIDVKTTILNGDLDEEVYMKQSEGFVMPGNEYKVCKLVKSFKFDDSGKGLIICLYVDDMLIFGIDQNQVDRTKKFLSSRFSMKDMGEVDVILGIKIKRENKRIVITPSHYIEKILKNFNRKDCSPVSTPMDLVEKLKPYTGKPVD
nr:zinc finger, CCHC-type [Tanacetum cinerariifolium]